MYLRVLSTYLSLWSTWIWRDGYPIKTCSTVGQVRTVLIYTDPKVEWYHIQTCPSCNTWIPGPFWLCVSGDGGAKAANWLYSQRIDPHIHRILAALNGRVQIKRVRRPTLQRLNDQSDGQEKRLAHQCRLWMCIIYVSEIADIGGTGISIERLQGQ